MRHVKQLTDSCRGPHQSALDSSDMGCGKTLCAVEAARDLGLIPFVVAPKTVVPAWEEALRNQGVEGMVFTWGKLRGGYTNYVKRLGKKKTVLSWQNLDPKKYLVIFDEIHNAMGRDTLQSKMVLAAKKRRYTILMLSATPMEHPGEMKAVGAVLELHNVKNFYPWTLMWGCEFDPWGSLVFPPENRQRLVELRNTIYPCRGSFLTKADLGEHFEECRINVNPIDFGSKKELADLMLELEEELEIIAELEARDGDDPIPLTKLLRLRQNVEMLKIPELASMVDDAVNQKMAVVVFLNFRDSIDALSRRLKTNHVFLHGGQSGKERKQAINEFQADEKRVIIAQSQAGGVGVSLHDLHGKFPRISFISPDYNAKNFKQVTGRTDRLNAKSPSILRILVAANTVENRIVESLTAKIENIDLLRGDPGIVYSSNMGKNTKTETVEPQVRTDEAGEDHHEYGPSGLKHRLICAGYKPKQGTNEAAEMGTRIHLALETGDWSKLSDWETHLATYSQNVIHALEKRYPGGTVYPEEKLFISLPDETIFGTCDYTRVRGIGQSAIVADYKTGVHGVADPRENPQAWCYATGVFQKFPEVPSILFLFICSQRDEISFGEFRREEVPELKEKIAFIINRSRETLANWADVQIADLNPVPQNCEYCSHAADCPALANKMLDFASSADKSLAVPDLSLPGAMDDPAVISHLLDMVPMFEESIKGWKSRSREMIFDEGMEIPGYIVKERSGVRKIVNVPAAWHVLTEKFGDKITLLDFLENLKAYPVGAYEDIVKKVTPKGSTKKATVLEVLQELEEADAVDHGQSVHYIAKDKA